MRIETNIQIDRFCDLHQIDISFIEELASYELVKLVPEAESTCILVDEIPSIEKMIRMHQQLDINPAGIDAIFHLLDKLDQKEAEIFKLRTRLNLYD
jgi:hypothetical protein